MTQPAIRVEGLWKEYALGAQGSAGLTFREAIVRSARGSLDRLAGRGGGARARERFWALQDVSFDVEPGEVVGIIGRNGAGKSTLLKILSRITAPSRGRVEIRGRIASLLEVGTGFHPELTGRENIRLNGAVLGMSQADIARKFDEIVAFSGVEKFIDTPVKRYSSGMQVRLAFAVAAHLEPEILLVDEVLAVGDAEFQKKCLGKMGEIANRGGRTVLFVSHQLAMISRLCSRAILMSGGSVAFSGSAAEAIDAYLAKNSGGARREEALDDPHLKRLPAVIASVELVGPDGKPTDQFGWHTPIRVRIKVVVRELLSGMLIGVGLEDRHQTRVATWVTPIEERLAPGDDQCDVELEIAPKMIAPAGYSLVVALFEKKGTVHHKLEGECPFVIVDSGSDMAEFNDVGHGVVIIPSTWKTLDGADANAASREDRYFA